MLQIKKLFLLFFFFLSPSFPIFSHTTGQKSAYLIGETDSTAQFTYGHLGRQPLKPLGSEVTHPLWPPSVHITNHHYHLHITLLTQPPVHYTTNTTTYYIHHTHTTTFTYNNNPLHTITWSCRHTCRLHVVSCRSHAVSCRLQVESCRSHVVSCRLCMHMTCQVFFPPHVWLFHCVPWHFQASTNPSV